jgi:hypothetical protein
MKKNPNPRPAIMERKNSFKVILNPASLPDKSHMATIKHIKPASWIIEGRPL